MAGVKGKSGVYYRTKKTRMIIGKSVIKRYKNGESFGFQKGNPYGKRFTKETRNKATPGSFKKGHIMSKRTKRRISKANKGKHTNFNSLKVAYDKILKEIPELEKQGFKCIPIGRVVPDIIAMKDGKIYAIEVEYGNPNYSKYDRENYKNNFHDVIWILRK